jgi:hypothetical protein
MQAAESIKEEEPGSSRVGTLEMEGDGCQMSLTNEK